MMTFVANLQPHVPLPPGSDEFVVRPDSPGAEIVKWIRAQRSPLLVAGPTGVGKSTELAYAAEALKPFRTSCLIQLDRSLNMRRTTVDEMLQLVARQVASTAVEELGLPLTSELHNAAKAEKSSCWSPATLAEMVINEVNRLSQRKPVTLLIDGLEKVHDAAMADLFFDALTSLGKIAEIVVVIPWHAAFGPKSETIIAEQERLVQIRPVAVVGPDAQAGRRFLWNILSARLGFEQGEAPSISNPLGDEMPNLIHAALDASCGIPRVFLQLIADAATYARLRGAAEFPLVRADLDSAIADQVDSFRRLFLPGDAGACLKAVGTDGREMDLNKKVRLMAHGILIERIKESRPLLELHLLAQRVLEESGNHA